MYMIDDSNRIYFIGGLTSLLGGFLMLLTSIWFILQGDSPPDVIHGVSVVIPILIVPTVIATTVLLIKDVKTGALLGIGFAFLWVVIDLLAHGSQSAPLDSINDLIGETESEKIGNNFLTVWDEWGNALMKIGAFLFSLAAFCYGLSLRTWGNPISAYLLIIAALTFPIVLIAGVDIHWHVLVRGIAFLFLGGVLMLATRQRVQEEWES